MTAQDILAFRQSLDLSQQQLADALGVSQSAVCLWETGVTKPRPIVFRMLEVLRERASAGVKNNSASA